MTMIKADTECREGDPLVQSHILGLSESWYDFSSELRVERRTDVTGWSILAVWSVWLPSLVFLCGTVTKSKSRLWVYSIASVFASLSTWRSMTTISASWCRTEWPRLFTSSRLSERVFHGSPGYVNN